MTKFRFKLRKLFLPLSLFLGEKHYLKKIISLYEKTGNVVFDGTPKFIDRSAQLDVFGGGKITIGAGSVITQQTIILTHDYSIDVGFISINKQDSIYESEFVKDVKIGKNTFIGQRTIILPGVTIGDNCIIGAGSVVTRDIKDNSVVAGVPCRFIKNTKEWAESKLVDSSIKQGNKRKDI